MYKLSKKIFSCVLAATVVFSGLPASENIGVQYEVKAATNSSAFADSYVVDSKVIPDVRLLNALKEIIGSNFTFGELKAFNEAIDLSAYTDIESVEGLGYALNATSIDLSKLEKVTYISKSEFQSCAFTSFILPPNLVEIEDSAFRYCQKLETIDFPNSLTKIHAQAFDGCTKLNNIILPEGLLKLGSNAFSMCVALTDIVIPDNLNATSESSSDEAENGIGTNVFFGCEKLENVILGAGMTAIPAGFLQGTISLNKIDIPESIMSVRDNAFMNSGLVSIDLSKNTKLTKINKYAFAGCGILAYVQLPESIEEIEASAFADCINLANMTFLENLTNLKSIGSRAFEQVGAENVIIPGNVTNIGSGAFIESALVNVELKDYTIDVTSNIEKNIGAEAFKDCNSLETVILPTKYENDIRTGINIGANAFNGCEKLSNINFPLNLRSIGDYAFRGCADSYTDWDELKSGLYGAGYYILPEYIYETAGEGREQIYFYTGDISKYYKLSYAYVDKANLVTGTPSNTDPRYNDYVYIVIHDEAVGGTRKIYQQYHTGINRVDLSKNKGLKLGKGVFYGCNNIEYASLPSDMYEIPDELFYGCATDLIAGNNFTYKFIASREVGLDWYHGLKTVVMSDNVTKIGSKAFTNCYALELNNNLPMKLTYIGANAFEGCESIGAITMPSSVEYIGNSAFRNCSRITDSQVIAGIGMTECDMRGASNIKYIGNNAFERCSFDYFLMNSAAPVTMIGSSAFANCQFLKAVSFSDSVEQLKSGTFTACSSLGTIDITDRCTIDPGVCTGLKGAVNNIYNEYSGYYTKDNKIYIGANQFSVTVRPLEKRLTVRENANYILPVYTALNNGNNSIEEIKIGDYSYTFDAAGVPDSSLEDSPLEPKIVEYTHAIAASEYNAKANLKVLAGNVYGNAEAKDVAVDVQMNLFFSIESGGSGFSISPSVSYLVDVTANPCVEISVDPEYYINIDSTKAVTIKPEFIAEFADSDITDTVEWSLKTGSEYVVLTPSGDGKSATVKATKNDYGNAIVSVRAGSIVKDFNVCVVAPSTSVKLDKSKYDMMYGTKDSLTATLTYNSKYNDFKDKFPDNVVFTSSDSSVVDISNRTEIDGVTKYDIEAVGVGTATITAKAQASGKTTTCVIIVSPEDIEMEVTDAEGKEIPNNSKMNLEGKTGTTYSFALSDELNLNKMVIEIEDPTVLKCTVNASKKTITLTGLKKGNSKVSIYPEIGTKDNGVTFDVAVDGNINYISLTKKTIGLNDTDSVFVSMKNVFGQEIKSASKEQYKSITDNEIVFESSNPEYIAVDNYGNVTVKKLPADMAAATITCNVFKNDELVMSKSTTVTPAKPAVRAVKTSGSNSVYVGKSTNIKLTISPSNANYTGINVSASNGYKNTLSYEFDSKTNTIKIKGVKAGSVTFTVTVKSSSKTVYTKTIKVTVKNEPLKTPAKVKQLKPKAGKKKATIKWKKVSGASGYQIQMSKKKKSGYKTVKKVGSSKSKYVKKKLKSKKKYYFRVRAYVKNSSGQVKYGKWSKVKKVKVK